MMIIKKLRYVLAALVCIAGTGFAAEQIGPGQRDGEVYSLPDESFIAWDAEEKMWLESEAFWDSFARRNAGRVWPSSSEFPPYDEVSEHDTFLAQTDSGPCLMYFFHTRWRRANDVRRWGDVFNEYGGCPNVFD
jgi:hypothetical protein